MTVDLPKLFHTNAKGTVYEWEIFTRGADIITIYGQVDGEKQQHRERDTKCAAQ